ncbi:MAG: DUF134 domain-containing protein [Bacteroidales bacterium]|nr:DUF134 domain-containing protein [Bacteroidales bacterium]
MPRPCKNRKIRGKLNSNHFKPAGIPLSEIEEIELLMEEFEALRLTYVEDLPQEESSKRMEVSQPTFSRILKSAMKKVSDAIVHAKAIKINNS